MNKFTEFTRFLEINLNHPAHYFTFGPFSVSAGNLSIIVAMIVIFTIALFAPFPNHERSEERKREKGDRS